MGCTLTLKPKEKNNFSYLSHYFQDSYAPKSFFGIANATLNNRTDPYYYLTRCPDLKFENNILLSENASRWIYEMKLSIEILLECQRYFYKYEHWENIEQNGYYLKQHTTYIRPIDPSDFNYKQYRDKIKEFKIFVDYCSEYLENDNYAGIEFSC